MDGCLGMCFGAGAVAADDPTLAAAGAFADPAVDLAPMGNRTPTGSAAGTGGTALACCPPPPGVASRTEPARAPIGTRCPAKIEAVGSLAAAPAALPEVPKLVISRLTECAGSFGSGSAAGAAGKASLCKASLSADRTAVPTVRLSLPSDCGCVCGCC